jgi:SAM-dependent methyltransferase
MRAVDPLLVATARAETRHFWFRGFRRFVAPLLQQATQGLSDVRLLDCGCGTGANLEMLGQHGRAFGFDLSSTGMEYGRAAGRTRMAQASVTAIPFRSDYFDVVTSFDVLYALPTPAALTAAREMLRVTRPGGHLIVNVAALDILRGDHSVLGREVQRFSKRSLRDLLTAAGFSIIRLTYTNASLFGPLLVSRTLQRMRGLAPEDQADSEISVPPALVNELLSGVLQVESWWLRVANNPVGSSLLCLARKPIGAAPTAAT